MKQEDFFFTYEKLHNNLYRITAQHRYSDLIGKLRTDNEMLAKDAFSGKMYLEYYDSMEEARQAVIDKIFNP